MTPCRSCGAPLRRVFCDLGVSPLANAYLTREQLASSETFHPLKALTCERCLLVQLEAAPPPSELFSDYAYFSSWSASWLEHSRRHAEATVARFGLGSAHQVVEVASNDGYLLQYFRELGPRVLGIEPAANVAQIAQARGIETRVRFFGRETADELVREGRRADLLVANNVLAHVPDLADFVAGLEMLLAPGGLLTIEFPHLLRLIDQCQFDTIYHEHVSYFSFLTSRAILARHGLEVFDVEELTTHGGSLRLFVQRAATGGHPITPRVAALQQKESQAGLDRIEAYDGFEGRVQALKRDLLEFLIAARRQGRRVAGYGAPAKGNTLLNYCGIREDLLDFTVDVSTAKQGRFLPGTRLAVHDPEVLRERRPDHVLILPWNLEREIVEQAAFIREWGGTFVVAVPALRIVP